MTDEWILTWKDRSLSTSGGVSFRLVDWSDDLRFNRFDRQLIRFRQ